MLRRTKPKANPGGDPFGAFADRIEHELRRLGTWGSPAPPSPPTEAFGADQGTFEQWLEHVLCPRLRELAAARADRQPPPRRSQIAAMAARQLPVPEGDDLLSVLAELDAYVESLPGENADRS